MAKGGFRFGAGRPGREIKVEDCRRLDIRGLQRAGVLTTPWSGRWQWRNPDSLEVTSWINLSTTRSSIALTYQVNGVPVKESIHIEKSNCAFGGSRPWLMCPGCNCRAALLLLCGLLFRCRRCHNLKYKSQSEDQIGRAWRAQRKLEECLSPHLGRPKGMHKTTRARLLTRIFSLEWKREDMVDVSTGLWSTKATAL